MVKYLKVVSIIFIFLLIGWIIPRFFIQDNTSILNDHLVSEAMKNSLNTSLDKVLFLKAKVSSGKITFNTPTVLYINAYTWFGIKYATVKVDCMYGNFFSSCSGVVAK
jgi:hypothetical protein